MNIYLSLDPEQGGESIENLQKLTDHLVSLGHTLFRTHAIQENPAEAFTRDVGQNVSESDTPEIRKQHIQWIDNADLLIADMSSKSEGRAMIIQRALDKPLMGMKKTPIIFILNKNIKRHFGKIVDGLIKSGEVTLMTYESIPNLVEKLSLEKLV